MEEEDQVNFSYHYELADFTLKNENEYTKWLNTVAKTEEVTIENLTYVFCDDEYLLDINRTYLKHDYYTDIITFPYQQGKIIESDIFISISRVIDNAKEHKIDFRHELLRVMVHGLLHLIGYGDKTDHEAKIMRAKEDEYVEIALLSEGTE